MHLAVLDDTEGVSLERIDILSDTNDKSNWHSSAMQVNYATPGYKNSNAIAPFQTGEEFEFAQKTFNPYDVNNLMILKYQLPESGYIANVKIFDSDGYLIKQISNNALLGTNGIFTWDGTNENGEIQRFGMYIVMGELYNVNKTTKNFKKVCVLAVNLD
jgi:hypothetical protein